MGNPITIHINKDEANPLTFSRSFIPWKILKGAVRIASIFDKETLTEADVDELRNLVVMVFGDQFTAEDLENYSDLGEMLQVIIQILKMINESDFKFTNPTQAG